VACAVLGFGSRCDACSAPLTVILILTPTSANERPAIALGLIGTGRRLQIRSLCSCCGAVRSGLGISILSRKRLRHVWCKRCGHRAAVEECGQLWYLSELGACDSGEVGIGTSWRHGRCRRCEERCNPLLGAASCVLSSTNWWWWLVGRQPSMKLAQVYAISVRHRGLSLIRSGIGVRPQQHVVAISQAVIGTPHKLTGASF
jgi:hypothetical protein